MEINKILSASILDVIFDGRNKEYGAYDLRKTYNRRISIALFVTLGVALLALVGSILANQSSGEEVVKEKKVEMTMQEIKPEEEKKPDLPPPPPPPPPPKVEPPKIETKAFTPPKIVEDEKVVEPPPAQEELKDVKIDIKSQEGIKDIGIMTPPQVVDQGKGVVEVKKEVEDEDKVFEKVEIDATFPGGEKEWRKYLEKKCNGQVASDNGAPPGKYKVVVQFIVNKEGKISDVKALTNFGYGMEQEAVRVIKNGPDWVAAQQNGRKVTAYRSQPITFMVSDE